MERRIVLEKPVGQTPLETIEAFRKERGLPASIPLSYAGRLDPMASGKLLVLIGEECKRQKEYTKLDKEYVVEVLLGVRTDTGDVLGHPEATVASPSLQLLKVVLQVERGTHERAYPVFSSKTVHGKPLFLHALEGTLDSVVVPTHLETIYRINHLKTDVLLAEDLRVRVMDMLSRAPVSNEPSKALGADFRIGTIRPQWEELLSEERDYTVLTLRIACASGTYMRTLAERIGTGLGTYGMALSIRRTRIGRFVPLPAGLGLWVRTS